MCVPLLAQSSRTFLYSVASVAFYASGFQSWDDAVTYLHLWGPRKRSQLESFLGIDVERHAGNPDVEATRNMNSDEEVEYYRTKYFSEEANSQEEGGSKETTHTQQ